MPSLSPNLPMDHRPVMLEEVLAALLPRDGEIHVDGTFGAGGYSAAILDSAKCSVIAIDRDKTAQQKAEVLREKYGDRLHFIHGCFGDTQNILRAAEIEPVDGFVLDIGVSSMQIDQAERGFSFRFDGPLDMRMDQSQGETAADLVNSLPEKDLADLIYQYGEERQSRKIARAILKRRAEAPFETTGDLADVVRGVVRKSPKDDSDPATRTFQALRIAVNDELGELQNALAAAEHILKPGGRMVVVTFHSLEDRIVKNFFREKSGNAARRSRHQPVAQEEERSAFFLERKKAVRPSDKELSQNPRARSAKLRVAIRAGADLGGGA